VAHSSGEVFDNLRDFNHSSWAIADAVRDCDIIHLNSVSALMFSRLVDNKFVYTMHHVHEPSWSEVYRSFPTVEFVTISEFSSARGKACGYADHSSRNRSQLVPPPQQEAGLSFVPRQDRSIKGTHLAIEVAKKSGIPFEDCRRSTAHLSGLFRFRD